MKMKKISIYTRDTQIASSSYYRIWQYFNRLDGKYAIYDRSFIPSSLTQLQYNYSNETGVVGIAVKTLYHLFVYVNSIRYFLTDIFFTKPETVVVLRSITPKTFFKPASFLYKALLNKTDLVLWDFDDDIFVNNEISQSERVLLEEKADHIIVTHDYLAKLVGDSYQSKVILMPTTEGDFTSYNPETLIEQRAQTYNDIRMVWLASSAGLKDIESISAELDEAANILEAQFKKKMTLVIVCNKCPILHVQKLAVEYHEWSREIARQELLKAHFGIMPLIDNKFSQGKGGFKIVQYMSSGLPQIASAVGFNREVISDNESGFLVEESGKYNGWISAILKLSTDIDTWYKMSRCAYKRWESNFSFYQNLETWIELIEGGD